MESVRRPRLVVLTGAGVSAESGISTYRDAGGLWDKYPVMQVASADGFRADPALIHEFYTTRRRELMRALPNEAHRALAELEKWYDVTIVTQNVDDLHERAGSTNVIHLHGELMKIRSMKHPERIYQLDADHLETTVDTRDPYGDPVRPHIVFFQEAVPMIEPAAEVMETADVVIIIGTSLSVYPAAGLVGYVRRGIPIYYIDPRPVAVPDNITVLKTTATEGMKTLLEKLKP